jgi:hypothetical protein
MEQVLALMSARCMSEHEVGVRLNLGKRLLLGRFQKVL